MKLPSIFYLMGSRFSSYLSFCKIISLGTKMNQKTRDVKGMTKIDQSQEFCFEIESGGYCSFSKFRKANKCLGSRN